MRVGQQKYEDEQEHIQAGRCEHRVAELVFLAGLALIVEPRNLCSLPGLGFSSGTGLTIRYMAWAYGPDDTIRTLLASKYCSKKEPVFLKLMVLEFFEHLVVAFRKSTCFVRDLQGNDLLTELPGREDTIKDAPTGKIDMGLFDFVKSADPFKIEDHTIVDEAKEHAGKKKMRVIFEEFPVKRLWDDAAAATGVVPTTGGKGPAALKRLELQNEPRGVGPSSVPPPIEGFVSSSITPTPESDIPKVLGLMMRPLPPRVEDIAADSARGVGALGNNVEASTSTPDAASPTDDFYDSQTVETAIADNIYVPE
ncbi:hypothetical protein Tco_0998543 [Tanacetum coccineum]